MKPINKLAIGIEFISLLLIPQFKAKAHEVFLKTSYNFINPKLYNEKIKEVSCGDVYGNVLGFGLGYGCNLGKNINANLELSFNSQKKDAIKQDLENNKTTYGYNLMRLINIEPSILYNKKITKDLSAQFGIGPSVVLAYLETKNEIKKETGLSPLIGAKAYLSLHQTIKDYFIRLKTSYRKIANKDNLDVSGLEIGIEIGRKF